MIENLNFQKQGLVNYFQDDWVLYSSVITDNILTVNTNGYASVYITNNINSDFKYLKCIVKFKSEGITDTNNYQTNPSIYIKEVYKNSENTAYRGKTRVLCFNNYTKIEDGYTQDETIIETLNKPLYSFYIKIDNSTPYPLIIKEIQFYKSIDISESQTEEIIQSINKKGQAQSINVNHNSDGSLNGLEFEIAGGYLWKVKPQFYNSQLIVINTNDGQAISVNHFVRDTDLETAN